MANLVVDTLRLKERLSGNGGAPGALKTSEPALNHVDETLYAGFGDDGSQNATSIKPIASAVAHQKAMDAATESYVNTAVAALTFLSLAGFDVSLVAKTNGAAFTVSPTMPTPAAGDNSAKGATTAFVKNEVDAAIAAKVDSAPTALDTLNELAAAMGDDPNFAATMTNNIATKCAKAANLSDIANPATAWANLGGGALGKLDDLPAITEMSCGTF